MSIPIFKMATVGILPSFLKKAFYRAMGAKIGKNVSLGILSIIEAKEIELGDYTKISPLAFILAKKFKTGKRVRIHTLAAIDTHSVSIGDDSVIMEQVVIGGMLTPRSEIVIGKRVKVFPYCFLNPTEKLVIDDDVGIGGGNYIFTHGSWQSELDGYPVKFAPVHIKKGTWFPWRVFVMPGVTVGEYCTIGAGSVITKDIPDRSLAAGSPAKVLRTEKEYVTQFSDQEKHEKVLRYLTEFSEYMNFVGKKCELTLIEGGCDLRLKTKKSTVNIIYKSEFHEVPNADVFISLTRISSELVNKIKGQGSIYFDLAKKESTFLDREEWYLIKDYFSRYGVRFDAIDWT